MPQDRTHSVAVVLEHRSLLSLLETARHTRSRARDREACHEARYPARDFKDASIFELGRNSVVGTHQAHVHTRLELREAWHEAAELHVVVVAKVLRRVHEWPKCIRARVDGGHRPSTEGLAHGTEVA